MAAEHFNDFSVATYNVGASQDISFQSTKKWEGFKKKLEAIETNEENVVDDRAMANLGLAWGITAGQCKSASAKLADFLQTYCGDDALRVVEACDENGFEG